MTDNGEDSTSQSMSPDSLDEERPLKKARYVWQIKSRYRLQTPRGITCHQPDCQIPMIDDSTELGRWQTRQMARAVVDNTINQVLEEMGFIPSQDDENNDLVSLDIFPTAHNPEGIENQAVLMAIQSHGLQKPCICSHSPPILPSVQNIPFHHRPSTSLPPDPTCTPSTSESQEKYAGESDFLAQAVGVAIQKKGLGSYSKTDHG